MDFNALFAILVMPVMLSVAGKEDQGKKVLTFVFRKVCSQQQPFSWMISFYLEVTSNSNSCFKHYIFTDIDAKF